MTSWARLRLALHLETSRSIVSRYDPQLALGSALKAYWDATDHGTARVTDDGGGLISSWKDRMGGLELVAATTARPILSTAFVAGRKSFLYDGTANLMRSAATTGLPTGANAGQTWVLYESVGAAATSYMATYGGTATGSVRRAGRSSTERWIVSDGSTTASANGVLGSTSGKHMSMGRWSGTTMAGRTQGALNPTDTTITTINTGTTRVTVGASNADTAANFFHGAISAVLITDDTLTLTQQQQLEAWGYREAGALDVLPADHPFKEGPDTVTTFTSCGTRNVIVANPAMQPLLVDFRTSFLDQIKTRCLNPRWVYAADGSKILIPANTAAHIDHDPVTGEPLGLANFSNSAIFNSNRTLSTPQTFTFTSAGAVPGATAWFDTNATLAIYALGSGQIRLQFGQAVHVLRSDGTDETDWGLPAITTTDITIDCVDEHAEGWYSGVHYFKMPRTPPSTSVTISKVGGATIDHCEATRGVAGPPTLTGAQRSVAVMEMPHVAAGLPKSMTAFTFCVLYKYAHVTAGAQILTLDDNDHSNPVPSPSGLNTQPVERVAINNLSNPRFDVDKSGFMGASYCTTDNPGDEDGESGGIDPEDVVMEKMKWRAFFGTGNWLTGELAVCCNGGAVRRATFALDRFPAELRMIRVMGADQGTLCPDGWLGGLYLEHASYYDSSDAAIKAMCDPANAAGIFGVFDPGYRQRVIEDGTARITEDGLERSTVPS